MRTRVSPALIAVAVLVVAAAVWMVYRGLPTVSSLAEPRPLGGRPMGLGPSAGRRGGTSARPPEVSGGESGTEPGGPRNVAPPKSFDSPLSLLGVEEGDVLVSCNGETAQVRERLVEAVANLQKRGEPITLVVERDGKRITLRRTERLPSP